MNTRSRLQFAGAATGAGAMVIALVAGFEGFRSNAYLDPIGVPTICFGETRGVRIGQVKTRPECEGMLMDSLVQHERDMRACIANPEGLSDKTYGALVSFTYNVGARNFCASTLRRKLNAGDIRGACNELLRWTRAGGRVLPGLVRRRKEERALCLAGLE